MDNVELFSIIESLIASGREDSYWDFKQEWHNNKADLLHDIICLANNRDFRESYLIVGVTNAGDVVGIQSDEGRRNTQQLNDFLSAQNFIGGLRPVVQVETLEIENHEIDVVAIKASRNVPFILARKYRTLAQGAVYTRIVDANTPRDSTASNDQQEMLWRHRFHLDASPIERLKHYLKNPDNWEQSASNRDPNISYNYNVTRNLPDRPHPRDTFADYDYYYKFAPEYTIKFAEDFEDSEDKDYLIGMWTTADSTWQQVFCRYHQTILFNHEWIQFDASYGAAMMRPERKNYVNFAQVPLGAMQASECLQMDSFIQDELIYLLNQFIRCKKELANSAEQYYRVEQHVITFENESEKKSFIKHVIKESERLLGEADTISVRLGEATEPWDNPYHNRCYQSTKILVDEYARWKTDNSENAETKESCLTSR